MKRGRIRSFAVKSFPPSPRSYFAAKTSSSSSAFATTTAATSVVNSAPSSSQSYIPSELIKMKREGKALNTREIEWFVSEFHSSHVLDYQMTAFLMAICTKGMNEREAMDLTNSLINTGSRCVLRNQLEHCEQKKVVDKHSTGGVGDKASLIVAPLAASLGLVVPMVCSRGLGHTGGTIDKLESVPGLVTNLSMKEFNTQLSLVGCAIVSPSKLVSPVENKIYALRDTSGTVESPALIASSIMSKKLANKPDSLLLDVKMGRGALMPKLNDAVSLARLMVSIGENSGVPTRALITNMEQPLGSAVGNFVEIQEAYQVLQPSFPTTTTTEAGEGNPNPVLEARDMALDMVASLLCMAHQGLTFSQAFDMAESKLNNGEACAKFLQLIKAQRGDVSIFQDLDGHISRNTHSTFVFRAKTGGRIKCVDPLKIGWASASLGAGRLHAGDDIDPYAGILLHAKVGDLVREGDPLFTACVGHKHVLGLSSERRLEQGVLRAMEAYQLCDAQAHAFPGSLIAYIVDRNDVYVFDAAKADLHKSFQV